MQERAFIALWQCIKCIGQADVRNAEGYSASLTGPQKPPWPKGYGFGSDRLGPVRRLVGRAFSPAGKHFFKHHNNVVKRDAKNGQGNQDGEHQRIV